MWTEAPTKINKGSCPPELVLKNECSLGCSSP